MPVLNPQQQILHDAGSGIRLGHLEWGPVAEKSVGLLHPFHRGVLSAKCLRAECNEPDVPDDALGFGRPKLCSLITISCVGATRPADELGCLCVRQIKQRLQMGCKVHGKAVSDGGIGLGVVPRGNTNHPWSSIGQREDAGRRRHGDRDERDLEELCSNEASVCLIRTSSR